MLGSLILLVGLVPFGDSAADTITLRDGQVVLGQWVEPAPRGKIAMVVRRAWAEKALPDRFKVWQAAEAPWVRFAKKERKTRLETWKREGASGEILAWIDKELDRLAKRDEPTPLMMIAISRGDVRKIDRKPADSARKLRQARKAKFDDAETRPLDELTPALEGRGFAMTDVDAAAIDALLPTPIETEARWKARRAATEVAQERNLRFIRYQGILMPEGTPGEAMNPIGLLGGALKTLLGEADAEDPLIAKGRELAAKGNVGLLVTSLETAEDLSGVTVIITLYARTNGERWEKAASRSVMVRGNEVGANDGANIGKDPQIDTVFKTAEGLGLAIPADLKQKSLNIGAATQKALGKARTAIQPDLDALALPVTGP